MSHDNDDCGDGDDKRYLNFKYLAKHAADFVWAYLLNSKLMCFVCFIFRKGIFTRKKTEQEEQKDQKRGKSFKLKQTEQR